MDDAARGAASARKTPHGLRLFDSARLERDGRHLALPLGGLRLLALLALRGSTTRGALAGHLWPDRSQERAQASLRTTLWRLRSKCDVLVVEADRIRLRPELTVDVHRLEASAQALAEGAPAPVEEDLAVVRLTSGDLLPGWFDDWALRDRERFRQMRLHLLEALSGRLLEEGRFAPALETALEAVTADPLRETPHRLVMRIHLAEGNYVEAFRQFQVFRELAYEELGVDPSPQMLALLRRPAGPPIPPPRSSADSASARGSPASRHVRQPSGRGRLLQQVRRQS